MIKSENEYTAIINRIEELLSIPECKKIQKLYVKLNLLSNLVADQEEKHHPIQPTTYPLVSRQTMKYIKGKEMKSLFLTL